MAIEWPMIMVFFRFGFTREKEKLSLFTEAPNLIIDDIFFIDNPCLIDAA